MQTFNLNDYDVIFLSYDEPNADEHYQQLLKIIPTAKRVHGVKGSDSAHKACANLATTERVIIIDGDNYVWGDISKIEVTLDNSVDAANSVFSWPSRNKINGLLYGNGGIKCWPTQAILDMKTHENADPNNALTQVDFCWELNYIPLDRSFSELHIDATKSQAWRAGFREGVKMSLDKGQRVSSLVTLDKGNLNRLKIWMTVGMDNPNGIWSIYGARLGCYMTQFTDWDHTNVRDFDYLNTLYDTTVRDMGENDALSEISRLGSIINDQVQLSDPFPSAHSSFFKTFDINPKRQQYNLIRCQDIKFYDIVMITYDEFDADGRYEQFKSRFPTALRVHGVKGIHNAHIEAAKLVKTDMFWVVDGDAKIIDDFKFSYSLPHDDDFVRVWRSINPVNDLIYGYGGVKLLPRLRTLNMDVSKPDMTTSISSKFMPVKSISNITDFNTDPYNAWKGAFRECVKLSSKVIDRQKDDETNRRLDIWCTVGHDRPYGKYAIAGAIAGREYGQQHKNDIDSLKKINDFDWLRTLYEQQRFD